MDLEVVSSAAPVTGWTGTPSPDSHGVTSLASILQAGPLPCRVRHKVMNAASRQSYTNLGGIVSLYCPPNQLKSLFPKSGHLVPSLLRPMSEEVI